MVKNMISRPLVFALLIAILSACTKQTEYTNVIPADATGILSINQKSLVDKAGLNDKENEAMKQKMIDALKSGTDAATFGQIEKIILTPSESGIDTESPIYMFTSPKLSYVVACKIGEKEKLEATINIAVKEKICEPIAQADGFQYVYFFHNIVAYNESVVLVVGVYGDKEIEEAKENIAGLMKQTSENSITNNKGFQKMLGMKGDVKFLASMAAIPSNFTRQMSIGIPQNLDMKDLMFIGDLNFGNGKISTYFEYYTENEKLKEQLKKQEANTTKLDGTFLKNFPASTIAFFSVGIQGEEMVKQLMENMEIKDMLAESGEVKSLINAVKGDISIGLLNIGIQNKNANYPQESVSFVAYAELTDDGAALNKIYENKQAMNLRSGEDIVKLGENEYVYKTREMNIFFGIKDDKMYATNDEMVHKTIFKEVDPSIEDMEFASNIKGKNIYFALNADAILELPVVKMYATFGGEAISMYQKLASKVSYLEITGEGNSGQMTLSLKDKDTNALKQMVDFARQFTGM